jgi:hypothetical protein
VASSGKTPTFVFLAAALVGLLPAGAGQLRAQDAPPKSGTVSGSVFDAATKEPLQSANVSLVGTSLGAVTDSAGTFEIASVPPGEYAVRASLLGYEPATRTDIVVTSVRPVVVRIGLVEAVVELEGVSAQAGYFVGTPELPVSVSRQSSEEIRRQPGGFEDVLRAVAILPGVAQVEAGRNDLIVRGGSPAENLYLLDGIEIPNINHFGTQGSSGGPLSYINLDFVDNTVFSTGGFGPRYGDKMSSVLGIELRDGRQDRLGGKLTLSATQFGLNLEGPALEKGSFLFSARRSYLDLIFKAADFGFVPEYWDFTGKWKYGPGPSDEIKVVAVVALDNVEFFNDTEEQVYDNSLILGNDQQQASGGISWRRLFGGGFFTVTFGQAYTEFSYVQRDTLQNPIFVNESIEHESSLRGDVLVELSGSTTLTAGLMGKRVRFSNDLYLPDFVTPYGDTLRADVRGDTSGFKAGVYAQVSQKFGRLTLSGGARQNVFTIIDAVPPIEPRFSASFAFLGTTSLSASVGRYTQSPSYVWLVSYPENRSLRAIRADQVVLGIDHALRPDTRLTLEAYAKRYDGYPASLVQEFLVLSNTGAGFGGSEESFSAFGIEPLESIGVGYSRGVELSVRKKLSEVPCYGLVSVSASETRYTALDGVERASSFDQRLIFNVGGGYLFNPNWEVGAKFRLVTGRPYTPWNPDGTKSVENFNGTRLDVNHSLDVRVDRRWFFDDWTLIAYIDVQNVYNRQASTIPTYDARTGTIEQEDSIGILPSIGISGEF